MTTPTRHIAIYGASGFGRETAWLARECAGGPRTVDCFIDDDPSVQGTVIDGIPVLGLEAARARFPEAAIVGGVGDPALRRRLMERAEALGAHTERLVHASVQHAERVTFGEGCVVCAGTILTTGITLGRHVQVNLACTIGHDAVLEEYVTLAPGVHVSGWVRLCRGAYVGTGAVLVHGTRGDPLVIGEGAVIGAGACVVKSVPPGQTVVGVPAKPIVRH